MLRPVAQESAVRDAAAMGHMLVPDKCLRGGVFGTELELTMTTCLPVPRRKRAEYHGQDLIRQPGSKVAHRSVAVSPSADLFQVYARAD